ncbi:hypothetical protein UFOVP1382_152 [uncultured Caudovirales phage]|uniref:Baseplate hub assembly protein, bacteriophage T4-like n=1 Tax=uncultured Caudovirales phage TaxID=2100421 RepID=A0A6J5S556_9CAUD|nr:hypothetical protein UFOVP1382_152 [uncultured Caudovirales phage]
MSDQPEVADDRVVLDTHHLDPKSTTQIFTLPIGYLSPDGKLLRDAVVKEMTGVEEEILAAKGMVTPRLNRVIANCLVEIGGVHADLPMVRALTMLDRMFLLIAIRRVSLGDRYEVKLKCPVESCAAENTYEIDLGGLPTSCPDDPTARRHVSKTPSGSRVEWHTMNGEDEEWLESMRAKLKGEGQSTLAMLSRIDTIDGTSLPRDGGTDLKRSLGRIVKMSLRDRNALRAAFKQSEGDLDTTIEFQCKACQAEFKAEMEVDAEAFFFPSGA